MDVYNKLTFINRISDQSEGIDELTDVYNKLTFINRISDQSEGIDEWMFITSLHSLTEYRINQRESMSGCL